MSDRTMLAFGRSKYSVPRATKRAFQVLLAVALTAGSVFLILSLSTVLTTHAGWRQGFETWFAFIRRSDILGTIILTAVVTIVSVYWTPDARK